MRYRYNQKIFLYSASTKPPKEYKWKEIRDYKTGGSHTPQLFTTSYFASEVTIKILNTNKNNKKMRKRFKNIGRMIVCFDIKNNK